MKKRIVHSLPIFRMERDRGGRRLQSSLSCAGGHRTAVLEMGGGGDTTQKNSHKMQANRNSNFVLLYANYYLVTN